MREPVDFDAAWAEIEEASGPSPRIKVRGEVIDLPHSMPAKVALYTVRHRERLEGKAPDLEAVHELAGLLLGSQVHAVEHEQAAAYFLGDVAGEVALVAAEDEGRRLVAHGEASSSAGTHHEW